MSPENLSRRAIMSSAAALPAVAILPTAIVATPAFAYAPDPIFAVIEMHQVLAKRGSQAYLELDRAKGRFRDKHGTWKPDALDKKMRTELTAVDKQFDGATISTHEDVDLVGRKFTLTPESVVELHGELDRQTAEYAETVTALEPASSEAWEAAGEADWDLLHTVPTTMAGIAALLRYVRESEKLIDYDFLEGCEEARKQFCGSLEVAVCVLAGLPAPSLPDYEDEDEDEAVQS